MIYRKVIRAQGFGVELRIVFDGINEIKKIMFSCAYMIVQNHPPYSPGAKRWLPPVALRFARATSDDEGKGKCP